MSEIKRFDLLLKEVEDPYVQENFRKLKRYLECLVLQGGNGTATRGPAGPIGPAGPPGPESIPLSIVDEYFDVDSVIVTSGLVTISQPPTYARVLLNGIELSEGAARDYVISGSSITINDTDCIEIGDVIKITYQV